MDPLAYLHSALLGHTQGRGHSPCLQKKEKNSGGPDTELFNKLTPRDKDDLIIAWPTLH